MKRIIIAASGGGLGNRLNSLFTGVAVHLHTGLPISVLWKQTNDFQCNLNDLFDTADMIDIIDKYPFFPFVSKEESLGDYVLIAKYYSTHPQPYVDVITSESLSGQLLKIQTYTNKYHFAVHGPEMYTFGYSNLEIGSVFFKLFRPKLSILKAVQSFISMNHPINGIHMRLTDKVTINNYLCDNIYQDLKKLCLNTEYTTFICSDDNECEKQAVSLVPNSYHIPKTEAITYIDASNINTIFRNKNTCVPAFIDFLIFTYCSNKYGINSSEELSTFFSCAKFLHQSFVQFVGV